MSDPIFIDKDGISAITPEGIKRLWGFEPIMQLPDGFDPVMAVFQKEVIAMADRSGKHLPYVIYKDKIEQMKIGREPTDEEKSEMYYYSNGCYSHIYGDPEENTPKEADDAKDKA